MIVLRFSMQGGDNLSVLMASVICSHSSMQEEGCSLAQYWQVSFVYTLINL
jgi:hypothetical protein